MYFLMFDYHSTIIDDIYTQLDKKLYNVHSQLDTTQCIHALLESLSDYFVCIAITLQAVKRLKLIPVTLFILLKMRFRRQRRTYMYVHVCVLPASAR